MAHESWDGMQMCDETRGGRAGATVRRLTLVSLLPARNVVPVPSSDMRDGWMHGWMHGCMDAWMDGHRPLRSFA
jgi:hypothetical protein